MSLDPVVTNPEHYKVVFENDRVRVLEYLDEPGHQTTPHRHPDSVMYTLCCSRAFGTGRRSKAGLTPRYGQRLSPLTKALWRRLSGIWPKATIRML
jgi:hypothetical protein